MGDPQDESRWSVHLMSPHFSFQIPHCILLCYLSGSEDMPPGWGVPGELKSSLAYYVVYNYKNAQPFYGGLQVALSVERPAFGGTLHFASLSHLPVTEVRMRFRWI